MRQNVFTLSLMSAALLGGGTAAWSQSPDKPVKFRLAASLTSLDWEHSTTLNDMKVWHQMYEGLYGMDEAKNGYYNELAKKVDLSKDGLAYTVTLLGGVKFQNGEPLKASDVVFSYKRAMKNPRFNYLTSMITDVQAVKDDTVKITLNKPYAPIAHTFFCVKVLNQKEVESQGAKFGTMPHKAGTGAYYVSDYTIATGVKLEAFNGYWRGTPAVKKAEYIVIPDDTSALIAYENHELDYFDDVPLSAWKDLSRKYADSSKLMKGNNIIFMGINYLSPRKELANLKVRQAICYAVNKRDINMAVCDGYGNETAHYMPPEYVPTAPDKGFQTYPYDPAKAKKLLAEAGYPKGLDVGVLMTYGNPTAYKGKMAQVIQANLAAVGIKCAVSVMDSSIVTPKLYSQQYDLCVFYDSGNYDFNNIRQQVHSESRGMYVIKFKEGPFDWKRLEKLVDDGAAISNVAKRKAIYTELWSKVMDTATILPCLHRGMGLVWSKGLDVGAPVPVYYKIRTFKFKA